MGTQNFELLVDGVPYVVKATPYDFNAETRYLVSFNGSDEYVFAWDSTLSQFTAFGDEGVDIPDNLEIAIANRLQAVNV